MYLRNNSIASCRTTECSNKNSESPKDFCHQTNPHAAEADHWTGNPCRPWMSSLFCSTSGNTYDSTANMSNEHPGCYPYSNAISKKQDDKLFLHARGQLKQHFDVPTQSLGKVPQKKPSIPNIPAMMPSYNIVGHPSLKIYKFRLPHQLLHLLDFIVAACHNYACSLPNGWT